MATAQRKRPRKALEAGDAKVEPARIYEEELLIGETADTLAALLESLNVTQRELARRLGVSEARISQILSGPENLTLKSLASIGWALGIRFELLPSAAESSQRARERRLPKWVSNMQSEAPPRRRRGSRG